MSFITLSGRRWKTHGSSKEGSGKEAGSKKASQKGGTEEEIIFIYTKTFFHHHPDAVSLLNTPLVPGPPCSIHLVFRQLPHPITSGRICEGGSIYLGKVQF